MTPLDLLYRYRVSAVWCLYVAYVAVIVHMAEGWR